MAPNEVVDDPWWLAAMVDDGGDRRVTMATIAVGDWWSGGDHDRRVAMTTITIDDGGQRSTMVARN